MYTSVFVGGTFDNLHIGHVTLLKRAFEEGKEVTIGLTTNHFVETYKHDPTIQPYNCRKDNLEQWVKGVGLERRAIIISIDDPYEPAASGTWEALVVTPETKKRGEEINTRRISKGLKPLALIEVELAHAEDGGAVSSTRIRTGQINREGKLIMPESMRQILAKPLGNILTDGDISASIQHHASDIVITVGDVTTKTLLDAGVVPTLAIVDFKVGRQASTIIEAHKTAFSSVVPLKSGPGFIAHAAIDMLTSLAFSAKTLVVVEGEEDLLVLPVVQYAPIGSIVYYGQPKQGMVEVVVTYDKKKEVIALLQQFT